MELIKAVQRMEKLDRDVRALDDWISKLQFDDKPVTGIEWVKLRNAINDVIGEFAEEKCELEKKIKLATENIIIDHD